MIGLSSLATCSPGTCSLGTWCGGTVQDGHAGLVGDDEVATVTPATSFKRGPSSTDAMIATACNIAGIAVPAHLAVAAWSSEGCDPGGVLRDHTRIIELCSTRRLALDLYQRVRPDR